MPDYYSLEAKINNKADKYEIYNLQSENYRLKRNIKENEEQINNLKSSCSQLANAVNSIIDSITLKSIFEEEYNQLQQLKQYI